LRPAHHRDPLLGRPGQLRPGRTTADPSLRAAAGALPQVAAEPRRPGYLADLRLHHHQPDRPFRDRLAGRLHWPAADAQSVPLTMSWFRWDGEDLILDCHLQPKASKDEFAGLHGERLKIRLTAPPVEGKANAHLQAFLAKAFGVAKSQVQLESGELNRQKRLRIQAPRS